MNIDKLTNEIYSKLMIEADISGFVRWSESKNTKFSVNLNRTNKQTENLLLLKALLILSSTHDYRILQKLYEYLNIDNEVIYNRSISVPNLTNDSQSRFMYCLAYVIYDQAATNEDIAEMLCELVSSYSGSFSKTAETFLDLFCCWHKDSANFPDKKKIHRLCNNIEVEMQTDVVMSESPLMLPFADGENIISSSAYTKYLKKRKTELSEYCNSFYQRKDIDENGLFSFLATEFRILLERALREGDEGQKDLYYTESRNFPKSIVTSLLNKLNGPAREIMSMTIGEVPEEDSQFLYSPDLEGLFHLYFQNYIQKKWYEYSLQNNLDNVFNKVILARECVPEPSQVLEAIQYLYQDDLLIKAYHNLEKQYILTFSWEKIGSQTVINNYKDVISHYQQKVDEYKNLIEAQRGQIIELQECIRNSAKSEINDNALEIERLSLNFYKKIESKDNEILELKKKQRELENYVELILKGDDSVEASEVDVSLLQTKKYLFVGHYREAYPKLKITFPNSIFMETETADISNISVDAIVYLVKHMSHAMYYKVQNDNHLNDVAKVYCNTKNINSIYAAMIRNLEF